MPAQPAARDPEEEMETEADPEVPQTNGEVEDEREGGDAEETMEESGEERDSDLEESEPEEEEEEEEESSGLLIECCIIMLNVLSVLLHISAVKWVALHFVFILFFIFLHDYCQFDKSCQIL